MAHVENERVHPLVTLLETVDRHASVHFDRVLSDEAVLGPMAQAWRGWFAGRAMSSAGAFELPAMELPRGGASKGGLGDDYPSGLFEALRDGWALAVRSLAVQGAAIGSPGEFEDLARAIEDCTPPAFAPTPSRVVLDAGGFRLRRISPNEPAHGEPILVLAPLVNRWYVLDFAADESFVAMLGGLGRPVYLVEWLPPQAPRDDRSFADLAAGPLRAMIDHVCGVHGAGGVALAGFSTGGCSRHCSRRDIPSASGGSRRSARPCASRKGASSRAGSRRATSMSTW